MRGMLKPFYLGLLAMALAASGVVTAPSAEAKREISAAELEKAKKEGDLSVEEAMKFREAFGKEADSANVESFEYDLKEKASGKSTYGVDGFDYLTGVGKVASDPSMINEKTFKLQSKNKSPLEDLMKKRFENKWTGQYNDTRSGWGEKTGVTEAWFRDPNASKLGASYDEWVNQWNNVTRPRHDNKTPIPGADPDQGAHWFSFYCIHCHGWTAKGDGPTAATLDPRPRNLTNGKYANYINNLDMFRVIKGGGEARNLSAAMPPWGNILQDQDIWNVVAFIRTLAKPEYTLDPDDVTAAKAQSDPRFQEVNEELELEGVMAGRGGGQRGGFSSIGGGRLSSSKVGVSIDKTSDSGTLATGDWAEDKK